MKYILILLLALPLFAKSSDECYSVQVKSFYLKKNSSYDFSKYHYPSGCKLITISGMSTVRCGCYESFESAKKKLHHLTDRYYDAVIVNTYKRRFNGNNFEEDDTEVNSYTNNNFKDEDEIDEIDLDESTYLDELGYK
jgi:hypothetical protein